MSISHEVLLVLAHKGKPLTLTVRPTTTGKAHIVHAGDAGAFELQEESLKRVCTDLQAALAFYPSPVTINGDEVNRQPFPDHADVGITTYPDVDGNSRDWRPFKPGHALQPTGNAFTAGVCCHIANTPPRQELGFTYYSPAGAMTSYWSKADKVTVSPTWVLGTSELKYLHQADINDGMPTLGKNPGFRQILQDRARKQVLRTLKTKGMPPVHDGPTYEYLIGPDGYREYPFNTGIPIIVTGRQVLCPEMEGELDLLETVATALYKADQPYVPVSKTTLQGEPGKLLNTGAVIVEIQPQEPTTDWPPFTRVDRIKLTIELHDPESDDEWDIEVDAPFSLSGDAAAPRVTYVPGAIRGQELTDSMVRAYWQKSDHDTWDSIKDNVQDLATEMSEMVKAAFDDPRPVFVEQLQRLANSFHPTVPAPANRVTVASADGRISLTYIPG